MLHTCNVLAIFDELDVESKTIFKLISTFAITKQLLLFVGGNHRYRIQVGVIPKVSNPPSLLRS